MNKIDKDDVNLDDILSEILDKINEIVDWINSQ